MDKTCFTMDIFLGNDSPLTPKVHANWRVRSIDSLERETQQELHYSSVVSLSASDVKQLLDVLSEAKIPTFAREGTKGVKAGALMGFSTTDFASRGNFISDKIVRILQGEKPRSLPMVDATKPKISLNLPVAVKIGFDPPVDLLASSDEIFQETTLPEDRLVK